MHIIYPSLFQRNLYKTLFSYNLFFLAKFTFFVPPILTMLHLSIIHYTYWTHLIARCPAVAIFSSLALISSAAWPLFRSIFFLLSVSFYLCVSSCPPFLSLLTHI